MQIPLSMEVSGWKKMVKNIENPTRNGRLPDWMYHLIWENHLTIDYIISWLIDVFHEWLIYWCHSFFTRPFCTTPWPFPPLAADSPTSQRQDRWRPRFVSCWWRCGYCFRLWWMQHDATIQVDSGLINHLIILYIYIVLLRFPPTFQGFPTFSPSIDRPHGTS